MSRVRHIRGHHKLVHGKMTYISPYNQAVGRKGQQHSPIFNFQNINQNMPIERRLILADGRSLVLPMNFGKRGV